MLVTHVFPSDGEYTVTVTPIFGDNMSPTGFGSVPCEKLEVLLDNDRLQLLDWQGSRRLGQPADTCGAASGQAAGQRGRGAAPGPAGGRGVNVPTPAARAARGGGGGFRNEPPPMRVRFKTTAGAHAVGVTFPATNFAPLLDLDQHFMRDTIQTGPTPGYTFFPHVGTIRIEGPFNAVRSEATPSRKAIFLCKPASAAEEGACARRIITNLATTAFRRPVTAADVDPLMEFYQAGRKEGDFNAGIEMALARILASPKFIYRIEEEPAGPTVRTVADKVTSYRIKDIDLARWE